jgi:hypothetical protein
MLPITTLNASTASGASGTATLDPMASASCSTLLNEDTEHRIADFQITDARACRGDQAGKISAEHQGKHGLRILAAAHSPISTVDTRRYYIDDDLARCRHGIRQVAVFQDFRTTELFNEGRFHNLLPLYAQRASFRE